MPIRVEDIAVRIEGVSPAAPAGNVLQRMLSDPALFAVPVVYDGAPLGHVTRLRLTELMASPNGSVLLAGQPISNCLNTNPVVAEAGTPVALLAKLAAENATSALTDGVIVLNEGRYFGLISPSALLKAVAEENAARAKAMQASDKRLDAARAQAIELAKEKSQFLAFVGHEIRTPLTGILGVADLLVDETSGETKRLARTIAESGQHLDRLLYDLLDLSRLEAGELSVSTAPFDLRAFANEARDLWQSRLLDRKLDLRISVETGAIDRIEGDATRIRQILFNLMSNALKFTEKGYVSVQVSTFEAAGALKLRLQVSDTGCGISDADKARMFEAFEQAKPSTAQTHGGTGLGLSIAKGLTSLMQGDIALADNPGGGSIFTVTVPVRKAGPRLAIENAPRPRMKSLELGRILVVEDHAVSALVISRALSAAGWELKIVETGEAALDAALRDPYQAILSDIHLPGLGGDELVRQLRSVSGPNVLAPILAITADVSPERRQSCARNGFTAVIEKPIRPRVLVATLADTLMHGAEVPEATRRSLQG